MIIRSIAPEKRIVEMRYVKSGGVLTTGTQKRLRISHGKRAPVSALSSFECICIIGVHVAETR